MIRKILLATASSLRTKSEEKSIEELSIELAESEERLASVALGIFLADMRDTMVANSGIGLAANQIGYLHRIFILRDNNEVGYKEYINPEILAQDDVVDFEAEGCLSIPGVSAKTKRFRRLTLRWQDRTGTTHEGTFEDVRAFAVQHEMEHLNGKLYVDQFTPLVRSTIMKKHKKYMRGRR